MGDFKDSQLSKITFNKGEVCLVKNKRGEGFLITKQGYYDFNAFEFHPYTIPVDTLFSQLTNLQFYNSVAIGEKIYLVNPSGGYVFEFDQQTVKRIDKSFDQRAYFNSKVFSYNNEIYLIGGYGLWEYKSQLLRFDFNLKEWVLEDKLLEDNIGFYDGIMLAQYDSTLDVIAPALFHNFKNQRYSENVYYTYDLENRKTKELPIDLKQFDFIFSRGAQYLKFYTIEEKEKIYLYSNKPKPCFIVFDTKNQTTKIKPISLNYFESHAYPLLLNNTIYALVEDKLGGKTVYLATVDLLEEEPFLDFTSKKIMYFLLMGILLILILLVLYYKIKISRFKLVGKKLQKGVLSINLNYDEVYFINELITKKEVENQQIISYFDRDGKSYDLNVKRKNAMIEKLEQKIFSKFNTEVFKKIPSPKDKRQGVYIATKKLSKG